MPPPPTAAGLRGEWMKAQLPHAQLGRQVYVPRCLPEFPSQTEPNCYITHCLSDIPLLSSSPSPSPFFTPSCYFLGSAPQYTTHTHSFVRGTQLTQQRAHCDSVQGPKTELRMHKVQSQPWRTWKQSFNSEHSSLLLRASTDQPSPPPPLQWQRGARRITA